MAGEVDKAVQREHVSVPAPLEAPAGESQDVEMTDAPAVSKTPEQVPSTALEGPLNPAEPLEPESAPEPAPIAQLVEAPKEAVPEPGSAPEAAKTNPPEAEGPKPTETTDAPAETALVPDVATQKIDAATDNVDNKVEAAPEKLVETPAQPAEESATAPSVPQPAEDVDAAKKLEAAEDAGAKMLASNLEAPVNGHSSEAAEPTQPEEPATQAESQAEPQDETQVESQAESQVEKPPVTGEKRKADDNAEANGDTTTKKIVVEDTPPVPTTNGSLPPRKAGRPKKDKKQPAPVGRTARRTRSQGAADV
ncbi:hypothetical protein B0T14DRAFT_567671 [Immersiella caudata]|uniref:Uncharacterized protein n=1 Tax=Immersiella caudata TaxID=314043 RepID=A0AA39WST3_9PEZI|nr:hypothetical protein B0T14DRAFT_567671 [Immersiella caudata]